jgi:hypothetical protein
LKLINIYNAGYKYLKSGMTYIQNWRVREHLKYSRNTKTTNEPTARNLQGRQTIGEHLGHLKDLEIFKYKRESKGHWPVNIFRFIFVICFLIWLSKHYKCKNI